MARVFIDGEEVINKEADRLPLGGGNNPLIVDGGLNTPDPTHVKEHLEGEMDELLICDRALSAEEISALPSGTQPEIE
jgi:hypothetical protein